MQAVQARSKQYANRIDSSALISLPIYWLTHMFGCWHLQKLGAPFTRDKETYRTCMRCGARRQFDVERSKHIGSYYYPPISVLYDASYHHVARVLADKNFLRPSKEDTLPSMFFEADFIHRIAEI